MAPATELLDELIEEIFFRIHPADAVTLTRAALVCTRWCRLIADPGFRRRLHEFHGAPHMLGYSCNAYEALDRHRRFYGDACFVRTSSSLKGVDMERSRVLDTRHGRVLLHRAPEDQGTSYLLVWDPVTKEEHTLPWPPLPGKYPKTWNAAVLCTATGCNHLDCHGKPFTVVCVATSYIAIYNLVYSLGFGMWREGAHVLAQQQPWYTGFRLEHSPSALVGNALYFVLEGRTKILKYSVGTREMHVVHLPPACSSERYILLMPTEDGRLGFATVRDSKLCLWSRDDGSDKGDVEWTPMRVIDIEALLPVRALERPADVVGFADGIGFFFIKTYYCGHFRIDIKSNRAKKIRPVYGGSIIFPYMSFHTPALGAVAASTGG